MNRKILLSLVILAALGFSGCSRSLEALRADGKEAFDKGNYAEAREYYLRALEQDKSDKESLLGIAEAYRKDSRLDSTIYYLKRADLMHPGDRALNEQIREVAVELGDWQNAINAIEAMVLAGDSYDQWYEQLADLWLKQGEQGRAFYHARRAIRHGTANQAIYLQTATWAAQYDSLEAAFEILDSAIARFGPLDMFVVNKALLLSYAGQSRQAETLLRPVVERDNPPVPTMQLNLANVLAAQPEKSKKREALSLYQQIRTSLAGRYPIDSLIQNVSNQLK
jgi:tetratricopeptide (TPR) repeat protein